MSNKVKINTLKIGTRGSPLALVQARDVEARLKAVHPDLEIEIVIIKTSGDWKPSDGEVRLSEENGGKGQFAKEIEEALIEGAVDIGVHSMKDMDSFLPEGLVIEHMLPREDVRDALLLSHKLRGYVQNLEDLPEGAKIGTASVRRGAFLLARRPDLQIEPFRGNVQTRIDKVRAGQVDATFLAMAGLNRLGLSEEADVPIDVVSMLPAAGQGAVGIEHRAVDLDVAALLAPLNCRETYYCVGAERAALKVLDGSCHTPIGAYAQIVNDQMSLEVQVSSVDGLQSFGAQLRETVSSVMEALALGVKVAEQVKAHLPAGFLS
jgi:hydroxymethylbilane synthase